VGWGGAGEDGWGGGSADGGARIECGFDGALTQPIDPAHTEKRLEQCRHKHQPERSPTRAIRHQDHAQPLPPDVARRGRPARVLLWREEQLPREPALDEEARDGVVAAVHAQRAPGAARDQRERRGQGGRCVVGPALGGARGRRRLRLLGRGGGGGVGGEGARRDGLGDDHGLLGVVVVGVDGCCSGGGGGGAAGGAVFIVAELRLEAVFGGGGGALARRRRGGSGGGAHATTRGGESTGCRAPGDAQGLAAACMCTTLCPHSCCGSTHWRL